MAKLYIKFDSAYQGESTYTCHPHGYGGSATVQLRLRTEAPDWLNDYISDKSRFVPEYVNAVGILRSTEHYSNKGLRHGEVSDDILRAFNVYMTERYEADVKDILNYWRRDRSDVTAEEVRAKHPPGPRPCSGYYSGPETGWIRLLTK